jgi:hypothetical protein
VVWRGSLKVYLKLSPSNILTGSTVFEVIVYNGGTTLSRTECEEGFEMIGIDVSIEGVQEDVMSVLLCESGRGRFCYRGSLLQ